MIDETGAITDCTVPSATKGDGIGKATCEALRRRVKLAPAIGADGKPVASFYNRSVIWAAPR